MARTNSWEPTAAPEATLRFSDFWSRSLSSEVLTSLTAGAQTRVLVRGERLAAAGEAASRCWIVLRGSLTIAASASAPPVSLALPGGIVAATAVRDRRAYLCEIFAAVASEVLEISEAALGAALSADSTGLLEITLDPALQSFVAALSKYDLPAAATADVLRGGVRRELSAADVAVRSGSAVGAVIIVTAGSVSRDGRTLVPGDCTGLAEAMLGAPPRHDVVACEASEVLEISASHLLDCVARSPALAKALRAAVADGMSVRQTLAPAADRLAPPRTTAPVDEPPVQPRRRSAARRLLDHLSPPFYRQRATSDCGVACLTMIAMFYHQRVDYRQLRETARLTRYGTSMFGIMRVAQRLGYRARGVRATWEQLSRISLPAIAHLPGRSHFVVVWRVSGDTVTVGDPAVGTMSIRREEFVEDWRGMLLLVEPSVALVDTEEGAADHMAATTGRFAMSQMRAYTRIIISVVAASVMLQLVGLAVPLAARFAIDRIMIGGDFGAVGYVVTMLIVAAIVSAVLLTSRSYLILYVGARVHRSLIEEMYHSVVTAAAGLFRRYSTGDVLSRFMQTVTVKNFVVENVVAFVLDGGMVFLYLAVLFLVSPFFAAMTLVTLPFSICSLALLWRPMRNAIARYWYAYDRYYTFLTDSFRNLESLKAQGLERRMAEWLGGLLQPMVANGFRSELFGAIGPASFQVFDILGAAVLLWVGAREVNRSAMTVGEFVFCWLLARSIVGPFARLVEQWRSFAQTQVSVQRTSDILQEEAEPGLGAPLELPPLRGTVEFRDVTFGYTADADSRVLHCVRLHAEAGELVGITGRSGCGKTTLLRLLLRLDDPSQGSVLLDGFDLRDCRPESIRSQIGVVAQDSTILSATIYDNIVCGRAVRDEAVVAAAKIAGAYDFIRRLPYGLQTRIGERGVALSGGERQRIFIARAVLTEPRMLIFDEATASLDAETEDLVYRNIREAMGGRTMLVVSHRPSALRHAARIVVMEAGRIVESGTYSELMSRRSLFFGLAQNSEVSL